MRDEIIKEYIGEVKEIIDSLKAEEDKALGDDSIKKLRAGKITNAINLLRICYDYNIKDIKPLLVKLYTANKDTTQLKGKIYFPYGQSQSDFYDSCCNRNLRKIDKYMPDVYNLIESLQSYNHEEKWFIKIADLSNFVKHDNEVPQERRDSISLKMGNNDVQMITVIDSDFKDAKIYGNEIIYENTNKKITQDKPLIINNSRVVSKPTNLEVKTEEITKFLLSESKEKIIEFLTVACECTKDFNNALYPLLTKY